MLDTSDGFHYQTTCTSNYVFFDTDHEITRRVVREMTALLNKSLVDCAVTRERVCLSVLVVRNLRRDVDISSVVCQCMQVMGQA